MALSTHYASLCHSSLSNSAQYVSGITLQTCEVILKKYYFAAIVGSGIGGSSCSYFLRERLKNDIDIDLYEANEIGGRLAVKYYNDEIYELGGSIIHERNKYMNMFCEKFSKFLINDLEMLHLDFRSNSC